jgi:hypothetical protein
MYTPDLEVSLSDAKGSSSNFEAIIPPLRCEQILKQQQTGIHEGQVSLTHGFVPFEPQPKALPAVYQAWDELAARLPQVLADGTERDEIAKLPLLDATDMEALPNKFLARVSTIFGNLAHAYYFNQRKGATQEEDPLPTCIKQPWE